MMIKIRGFQVLIIVSLLISGCALVPETTKEVESTLSSPQPKSTITPEIRTPTETTTPVTPSPMPAVQLSQVEQVVFTIPNTEPWSGREGDPRPDWIGWGAETFSVAPNGTIWIADTAAYPHRLLHYNPQGELLMEISLQDVVVYPYDFVVAQESIWVLDISSQQPKVVQLGLHGELLISVDIDKQIMTSDGSFISNGVGSLLLGEKGELLLHGINGYTELIDSAGEVVARSLDAIAYYGHTYHTGNYDETTRRIPVFVDGAPLETPPDFYIETPAFLGFNLDGSFALVGYVQDAENQLDHQVNYYTHGGELLGLARQRPQIFYKEWNHHLAFGPDGSIYQLLSNPDHSVQIVRLGFVENLPPRPKTLLAAPTPLTLLLPSESTTTEEEQARNTLIGFFADLSAGNYAEAAAQFGGEVNEYARAPMPGETIDDYWEYICGFLWCLPVSEITNMEQVSENKYIFYTVFMQPDGTRFEIGACCGGDPAATPPVWQFAYPVQKIDGVWKVMRAPLFIP